MPYGSISLVFGDSPAVTIDMNVIGDKPSNVLPFGVSLAVTSEPPAHVLHIRRHSTRTLYVYCRFFSVHVRTAWSRVLVLADQGMLDHVLVFLLALMCRLFEDTEVKPLVQKSRTEVVVSIPELRVFLLDDAHQVCCVDVGGRW